MVPRMVWVSRHSGRQSLFRRHLSGCVLRAFALFLRDDRSPGQALSALRLVTAHSLGGAHGVCLHPRSPRLGGLAFLAARSPAPRRRSGVLPRAEGRGGSAGILPAEEPEPSLD